MDILSTKYLCNARNFSPKTRILYVRKLLIANSLVHGAGMPISYHKFTVRLAEHMLSIKFKRRSYVEA